MLLATEVFHFDPDITGISCSGRFTLGTRLSETEAMVQTLLDQGVRKLVLDLTHVDFVDSAGLGIIMRMFGESTERGGQFRISGPRDQVRRLFDITHTSAILSVDPDLVTSVQKLQESKAASTA
jgi:anti-sigma B factor antagonist